MAKLVLSTLGLQDIIFSYQRYWWLSLKFTASITSFNLDSNALLKSHTALLPKLRVMKTILVATRYNSLKLEGLGLHSLEVESTA